MSKVYDIVTDKIVAALEKGIVPWHQTWSNVGGGPPISMSTGKGYRGVNPLLLWISAVENGFASRYWGTRKNIEKLGGTVKDDEKSTLVTFWKSYQTTDEATGREKTVPVLRYYLVWNADQVNGLPEKYHAKEPALSEVVERPQAEQTAKAYLVREDIDLRNGGNEAFYSPAGDYIRLPKPEQFRDTDHYWAAAFHEITHSTGHSSRLNVNLEKYGEDLHVRGEEEFRAELGAAFLASLTGLEGTFDDSAAYIGTWMKDIKEHPKLVVTTAARAQKAVDFVLGVTFEQEP